MLRAAACVPMSPSRKGKGGSGDDANSATKSSRKMMKSPTSSAEKKRRRRISFRVAVFQFPAVLLFAAWTSCLLVQHVYRAYVTPIIVSYKRNEDVDGKFYDEFRNEFTYYDRRCGPDDVTTTNSSDLLVTEDMSSDEAADVMLEHGAVAFRDVLSQETASKLRAYVAEKQAHELDYNEVFWTTEDRLSLGLGPRDHPSIAAALEEVGSNKVLKTALEAIVGEDPAIVEISTLTSMSGSDDQNIHSDSDYFGSSLLHARSFLHSYSLFVALQDTPKSLGATTVCPGSHYCADVDLDRVCLESGAFSVSTNGKTGDDGLLKRGDAFMFNQNIWHRGPGNRDENSDRIMFIITFMSSKRGSSDLRRQGLGTYYYLRWNLWGHTFSDLKNAGSVMVQPWAALRALGLLPSRGITWIHQFAQQIANAGDFYEDDVLEEFKKKVLDHYRVPFFLRSDAVHWEEFIPVLFGVFCHFRQTDLAKSVTSGKVSERPYSAAALDAPITSIFPERNDVLFSSRYSDAFLASYTRFLDFHPGNKRWKSMVDVAKELPKSFQVRAADAIVEEVLRSSEAGIPARFLRQNEATGHWQVMTMAEAITETSKAMLCRGSFTAIGKRARVFSEAKQWRRRLFAASKCPRDSSYGGMASIGDLVWAWDEKTMSWKEAIFVDKEGEKCTFNYFQYGIVQGPCEAVRIYERLQSGEGVQVDYHGDESEIFDGTILSVHPDGFCEVLFEDGSVERIKREFLLRWTMDEWQHEG